MGKRRKCSVPNCNSTNENEILYSFPKKKQDLGLWLSFIIPLNGQFLNLSDDTVSNRAICRKHFENKYIRHDGIRLRYSYPTLATEEEIVLGKPIPRDFDTDERYYWIDHDYHISMNFSDRKSDHNYAKIKGLTTNIESNLDRYSKSNVEQSSKLQSTTVNKENKAIRKVQNKHFLLKVPVDEWKIVKKLIGKKSFSKLNKMKLSTKKLQHLKRISNIKLTKIENNEVKTFDEAQSHSEYLDICSNDHSIEYLVDKNFNLSDIPDMDDFVRDESVFDTSDSKDPDNIATATAKTYPKSTDISLHTEIYKTDDDLSRFELQNKLKDIKKYAVNMEMRHFLLLNKMKKLESLKHSNSLLIKQMKDREMKLLKLIRHHCYLQKKNEAPAVKDLVKSMTSAGKIFTCMQYRLSNNIGVCNDFTNEEKSLCLFIYESGIETYHLLQSIFHMPSEDIMQAMNMKKRISCEDNIRSASTRKCDLFLDKTVASENILTENCPMSEIEMCKSHASTDGIVDIVLKF